MLIYSKEKIKRTQKTAWCRSCLKASQPPFFFAAYSQPAAIKQKTKYPNCLQLDSVKPTVLIEKKKRLACCESEWTTDRTKMKKKRTQKDMLNLPALKLFKSGDKESITNKHRKKKLASHSTPEILNHVILGILRMACELRRYDRKTLSQ